MNLESVKQQIKSEIKIDASGKGTASIRATARLCDVSDMALVKSFQGANLNPGKLAAMLIEHGFKPQTFNESGVPDLAVAIVVKYYAYSEYSGARCTEQARLVDLAFSGVGARVWMRETAGWHQVQDVELAPSAKLPHIEAREIADQVVWIQNNIADKNISIALINHAMSAIKLPALTPHEPKLTPSLKNEKKSAKPNHVEPTGNYKPLEFFFLNQVIPEEFKSFPHLDCLNEHLRLMSVVGSPSMIPWYKDCFKMREKLELILLEIGFDPDLYLIQPR